MMHFIELLISTVPFGRLTVAVACPVTKSLRAEACTKDRILVFALRAIALFFLHLSGPSVRRGLSTEYIGNVQSRAAGGKLFVSRDIH